MEVSELIKHRGLGRWQPIRSSEARIRAPADTLSRRFKNGNAVGSVLWVDTMGEGAAAKAWADHARRLAELPDMPRLCIMMDSACAEACDEDKRLRRRLWREFVTPLDARALVERVGRRSGHSHPHSMFRSTLIAELAGTDLVLAERLSRVSLGRMMQASEHPREPIWRAQVSILLPLVESERRRQLDAYRTLWRLPHLRKDGKEIVTLENLEIGDMAAQARFGWRAGTGTATPRLASSCAQCTCSQRSGVLANADVTDCHPNLGFPGVDALCRRRGRCRENESIRNDASGDCCQSSEAPWPHAPLLRH